MTDDRKTTPGMAEVSVEFEHEAKAAAHEGIAEDPVLALKREWDARWERYKNEPDKSDETMKPHHDGLNEAELAIHRTPATTHEGIAVKLRMWAQDAPPSHKDGPEWWSAPLESMAQ